MEYIVDFIDKHGDYDSISVSTYSDDNEEENLCQLLNEVINNKSIKEVIGVESIEDCDYDNEEEDY